MPLVVLTLVEFVFLAAMWAAVWITFGIVLGHVVIPFVVDRWDELKSRWSGHHHGPRGR